MPDGRKRILGPFIGRKKRKAWNKTGEKYYAGKKKTKFTWNRQGIKLQRGMVIEEFLDSNGAFYNGNESDTEAVVQRCSLKKVFLEIPQSSQENTCTRVSFLIKLEAWRLQLY